MIELGELEKQHERFASRKVSVVCIGNESLDDAAEVKRRFPSLIVVADTNSEFARGADILLEGKGPKGAGAMAPTTLLLDADGIVQWIYRPATLVHRLSPDELLEKVDEIL